MVESNTFPYVEGKDGSESQKHVQLKGLAVYWLLQRGFELSDISEEYAVSPNRSDTGRGDTRYADIHAEHDGHEVFIECERGQLTEREVSMAGSQKAREGETVFVFGEDGVYELVYADRYVEEIEETVTKLQLNRVSNLPMLDLSGFE
jgi:hypothetical protein